jgi:hypothetical protein
MKKRTDFCRRRADVKSMIFASSSKARWIAGELFSA